MALKTIEKYPLPFDEELCELGAFTIDALVIINKFHLDSADKRDKLRDFAGSINTMLPVIQAGLADPPIHLGIVLHQDWGSATIQVVWKESVSDAARGSVIYTLQKVFKDEMTRWPSPPTNAYFMIWSQDSKLQSSLVSKT